MTTHKYRLSPELAARAAALATDLNAELDEHQTEFDGRSERWQEGEAGTAVGAWIEHLEELVTTLEGLPEEPE